MYLTPDEFKILNGIKMGLSNSEIEKKFKMRLYCNDPRLSSLYKKYGIKNKGKGLKYALFEKADLDFVKVVSIDEIPYFEYENTLGSKIPSLVKKIKITKKDVSNLFKYFRNVDDEDREFELIFDEDAFNMFKVLEIKDPLTGNKTEISSEAD